MSEEFVNNEVAEEDDNTLIPGMVDNEVMEVAENLNNLFNAYKFTGAQLNQLARFTEFSKELKFPGGIINPDFSPSRIRTCIDLTLGLKTDEVGISERYDIDSTITFFIQQVVSDARVDDECVELVAKLIYAIFTNDSAEGYNLTDIILYVKGLEDDSILELIRYIENGFILDISELDDISNEEFFARRIKMLNERYQQWKKAEDADEELTEEE